MPYDKPTKTKTIRVTEADYLKLVAIAMSTGNPLNLGGAFRACLEDRYQAIVRAGKAQEKELSPAMETGAQTEEEAEEIEREAARALDDRFAKEAGGDAEREHDERLRTRGRRNPLLAPSVKEWAKAQR